MNANLGSIQPGASISHVLLCVRRLKIDPNVADIRVTSGSEVRAVGSRPPTTMARSPIFPLQLHPKPINNHDADLHGGL